MIREEVLKAKTGANITFLSDGAKVCSLYGRCQLSKNTLQKCSDKVNR